MTTQDEARETLHRDVDAHLRGSCLEPGLAWRTAARIADEITDDYYLVPRAEMPETAKDEDGYVKVGAFKFTPGATPEPARRIGLRYLAAADRLEVEQAKTAEVERELAERRNKLVRDIETRSDCLAPIGSYDTASDKVRAAVDIMIEAGINPEEEK